MATSQNGWSVYTSSSGLQDFPWVTGRVRPGDVYVVLDYLARRFHAEVENIRRDHSWGYAYRSIRGKTSGYSNHASATALDFNAPKHVLGARGTFTAAQVRKINEILSFLEGAVRWGGSYSGRADEMHFEINKDAAFVKRIADKIRNGSATPAAPKPKDTDMPITFHWNTKGAVFTAGPQFIKAETDLYNAQVARNIGRGPENTKTGFVEAGDREFTAICESLGIPWYAVQATLKGEAFLIDGRIAAEVPGMEKKGFFWSREIEVQQGLRAVQQIDTTQVASVLGVAAEKAFADLSDKMADKITGDFTGKIVFEKEEAK